MDGRDYFEVRRKGADAIAHVRAGAGPCLVHALVTRPYSHSLSDDQRKYRGAEELADEAAHDPIVVLEHQLVARGALTLEQVEKMRADANEIVRAAADAALAAGATCARQRARTRDRRRRRSPCCRRIRSPPRTRSRSRWAKRSASRCTSRWRIDERIRVFGEDVADADPARHGGSARQGRRVRASPSGCNARSATPVVSTRRSPRRTSSAAQSGRPCAGCGRAPRSSSSTTCGRR